MTPLAAVFLINQDVSAQVRCCMSVLITASTVSTNAKRNSGIFAAMRRIDPLH
jgi:hypothetical protein